MTKQFVRTCLVCCLSLASSWQVTLAASVQTASAAFGYALQAMGSCDDFIVHGQTEQKLSKKYGVPIRGDDLREAYMNGLFRFSDEESEIGKERACKNAWRRVGPSGTEYPGLLMANPFK